MKWDKIWCIVIHRRGDNNVSSEGRQACKHTFKRWEGQSKKDKNSCTCDTSLIDRGREGTVVIGNSGMSVFPRSHRFDGPWPRPNSVQVMLRRPSGPGSKNDRRICSNKNIVTFFGMSASLGGGRQCKRTKGHKVQQESDRRFATNIC